jgi:hypothetical protein
VFEGPGEDDGAKADDLSLPRGEHGPWRQKFEDAYLK